jgi:hypothetical protein
VQVDDAFDAFNSSFPGPLLNATLVLINARTQVQNNAFVSSI